jgi:micrococcal nuclease
MDLYWYKARCESVTDGDTVRLIIDLGMNVLIKEKVRIVGINAAEIHGVKKTSDEYKEGMLAKEHLEKLLLGKDLFIKTHKDKKGKYGRYLCEIFYNDQNIGDLMVKEGFAEYKEY